MKTVCSLESGVFYILTSDSRLPTPDSSLCANIFATNFRGLAFHIISCTAFHECNAAQQILTPLCLSVFVAKN